MNGQYNQDKILWIDTETLSFDPKQSDIFQIAGFIEIDGKITEKFNWFFRPDLDLDKVSPEVWDFHKKAVGLTREDIENFSMTSKEAFIKFMNMLSKYVDKYDRGDKFAIGGHNVQFDLNKIYAWAREHEENYLASYLSSVKYDTLYALPLINPNIKYSTLALEDIWDLYKDSIGVEFKGKSHNAAYDITRTYLIWKKLVRPVQDFLMQEFLK